MNKKKITLACNNCKMKNYKVTKSIQERLIIKKYCKVCKSHIVHKEEK